MPYMNISTSLVLSDGEKHALCEDVGAFISLIPGKRREITMMNVAAGLFMELGPEEYRALPCMDIEFRISGIAPFTAKRDFVRRVTEMLGEKYGLDPSRVFFNIFECGSWGAFGHYKDNNILDESLYD